MGAGLGRVGVLKDLRVVLADLGAISGSRLGGKEPRTVRSDSINQLGQIIERIRLPEKRSPENW